MNKKGASLGSMYPAVLAIILVGIALGIGIFVLGETSNAISTTDFTVNNETILLLNGTAADVDTANNCGAHNFAIIRVTNASADGTPISSGNYTFSSTGSLLATVTSIYGTSPGTNVNITYTYTGTSRQAAEDPSCVLETSATGVGGIATWVAVIVVVLAAAVVLGIVLSSFGKRTGV